MSDVVPPIRSAGEMLPHSPWVGDMPGLRAQVQDWLETMPAERVRLARQARAMAAPALHPAGIGRLLQVAGRVIGAAAGWATVDLGRAVYRSVVFGDRSEPVRNLMLRQTQLFNLTGHPAVVLPCGRTAAGLPCSIQLVGKRRETEALLNTALSCTRVLGSGC